MSGRGRVENLRRLARSELVLGQILAGHVRDRAGRILLRKGQRLLPEHLQALRNRRVSDVYAGQDWVSPKTEALEPKLITADELMQAMKRRRRVHSGVAHGRHHARYRWQVRLRVVVQECWEGVLQRRQVVVTTCDLSASGFAFVCRQFVHPGTVVSPRIESLPNRPVIKGIVRHCLHLGGCRHRVGVEFVEPEPGETIPWN